MDFFTSMARQSFRTGPDGQRLFCADGPWTRPYIVPDAATEERLINKQKGLLGVLIGLCVAGPITLVLGDADTLWTLIGFVGLIAIAFLVRQLFLGSELRSLTRASARLSLHDYLSGVADRRPVRGLVLRLLVALCFVGLGVNNLVVYQYPVVGWMQVIVFTAIGAVNVYTLALKLSRQTPGSSPSAPGVR